MKKKIVSVLLSAAMVATLVAGCGKTEETPNTETTTEKNSEVTETVADVPADKPADEPAADDVVAEEIPTPVYYYSFDAADDNDSIKVAYQDTNATPIVQTNDDAKTYIPGVKGDAIYTNGVKGYKLTDVNGVGDTYTVSFWI